MFTVVETPQFQAIWPNYWTEKEFAEFCLHIAAVPDTGDVVANSNGVRKVRWTRAGRANLAAYALFISHAHRLARSFC